MFFKNRRGGDQQVIIEVIERENNDLFCSNDDLPFR